MNSFRNTPACSLVPSFFQASVLCLLILTFVSVSSTHAQGLTNARQDLSPNTLEQIGLLQQEKLSRTPAQKKLSSQLLYHLRQKRQGTVGFGLNSLRPSLRTERDGRILVDMNAKVSPALIQFVRANGGVVVNTVAAYDALRALVPPELTEQLASRLDVKSIRPAARATTSTAPATYEAGDIAHRTAEARRFFGVDGTGIKVGVLSDSVDGLTNSQASGALPAVTILPGQAGTGTGEGTAMLEIIHALAPGSPLYFATAFNSEASFAQNIRALQAAGCKIIIDDVTYFDESPFQDGPIAQAVNDVSAAGVLYFSCAGNSGGADRGTSGTWEGDFKDGGLATIGQGGRLHDFGGGVTFNTVLAGIGFERLDLTWSDPLGHSANDYDVYVLDASGNIVRSSTDNQSGSSDPYETVDQLNLGDRIVIVKFSGDDRFLHLSTGRGRLTLSTAGTTYGHNASGASNAFCVAATRVASPAAPFVGGSANPVETFSSDGPRRVFFNPDGSPITTGNFSSTGGKVLQKPDITAADGVNTTLPGFAPFYGTSAATPHAGAIAALLLSYNPFLSGDNIRTLLTNTALSISGPGFDRNSGFGIVMGYPALAAAPEVFLQSVQLNDANHNGSLDSDECADVLLTLHNSTGVAVTGITAVLTSSTPQVYVDPAPRSFPDLQPNASAASSVPFHISTGPGYVCASNAVFRLQVTAANLGSFSQPFVINSPPAGLGTTSSLVSTNVPLDIPDLGTVESGVAVSGVALPLAQVRVGAFIKHTYDQDLRISLVAPDDTEVVLSANNGQSGQNYGSSCSAVTRFSDDAVQSITAAAAPFIGTFTPEQPLSTFQGKSGAAVNGVWRLRVEDQAAGDTGTLICWSLELTPITCLDGGSQCLSPPQLTKDLSDKAVTNGASVQFTVTATGTDPLAYQWYFDGIGALSNQTNSVLNVTNIGQAQLGNYQVVITNLYGSITSSPANLRVVVPATILTGPTDQLATNGQTVTFSVLALGDPPIFYQWYFNVTNAIPNATNSALVIQNVGPAQTGTYDVVVTNAFGSVTSGPARLRLFVPPVIVCSSNATVELGAPWVFTAPSFADTNLVLTILDTTTNALCGASYSATRQWLISATNGYQVTCSQTVQVLDTTPPVVNCPPDKTNVFGSNWTFDVPTVKDAGSSEALVYDNFTNSLNQNFDPGLAEAGNQVTLAGNERFPSRFSVEYWATNGTKAGLAGSVTIQVRFYNNDGPALPTGEATPGTVLFESRPIAIGTTKKAALVLQDFQANALTPLQGPLPSNFTWTVQFADLGNNDSAGVRLYGPPVVGQVTTNWTLGSNGWTLQSGPGFGGQLAAQSASANLTVLTTVTNAVCGNGFTTTRTWLALDGCSNATTCSQTVTIVDRSPPLVVQQPQDLTAPAGQDAMLSVTVSNCPPISYQWYFNATNRLAQATSNILVLKHVVLAQSGSYQAVITNAFGSVTSTPALLTVVPVPTISSGPTNQVVTNGNSVQWNVVATGSGPLSYQWFFGTLALPGQTNTSLVLSNVSVVQAGNYTVVVTDRNGSTISAPAQLQVLVLPTLVSIQSAFAIPDPGTVESRLRVSGLTQPLARVIVAVYITHTLDSDLVISLLSPDGTEVILSAANGGSGQNYGSGCGNFTVFSDASTNSITLAAAPFVGTFKPQAPLAAFLGKSGNAVNGLWTLRVVDQSPGDSGTLQCWSLELDPEGCLAGGGPCLTSPQITQDISDQIAAQGATVNFTVAAQGAEPLFYQWYFNTTNLVSQGTDATLILTNVNATQEGGYQVVITNVFGSVTSSVANLRVTEPARILIGPSDQTVTNGDTVTWTVLAEGAAPLSFQWFFNSTNALAGATKNSLILSNVTSAQDGTYSVVATNLYGSSTSAPAKLLVRPLILCSPDKTVALSDHWNFDPPTFTDTHLNVTTLGTVTNTRCGDSFTATRQWLISDTNNYQVTCSQTVHVLGTTVPLISCPADKTNVYGSSWSFDFPTAKDAGTIETLAYDNLTNNLDLILDPGLAEVGNQVSLAGNERFPTRFTVGYWGTNANQQAFAGAVTARIRFYNNDGPLLSTGQATPGTVLYDSGPIPVSATHNGGIVLEDFQLNAAKPLQGPLPANFTWTVRFAGLANGDAAGLTIYSPPIAGDVAAGYWASGGIGWALLGQSGQSFGAQLVAVNIMVSLSVLDTETNAICGRSFAASRVWQAVDTCGNTAVCTQTVTVVEQAAPAIASQPEDQSAVAGQTVSLQVTVSTCPPIGYQWFFNGTNALANGTASQLVLTNIGPGQAGTYFVVVTNNYGSITSTPANLVVNIPAIIVGDPPDLVATNGDDVHLRVLAKGTPPLFYQWFFNLTNILDQQTGGTLDLSNVSPSQAGTYSVIVTNAYGSDTSSPPANLTVVVAPTILSNPQDQTVTNGDGVAWTVFAQGTGPLTYQWFFNNNLLGLETNATFAISNVIPAQAGNYQVVVANTYGSVTSTPAKLTVVLAPRVACSGDSTVTFGNPWNFTPPSLSDPSLSLQVVNTTTNVLCGNTFDATRQWVITDTNGAQVFCTQTVHVQDPSAPILTCTNNKTVNYGDDWSFDNPTARESGAIEGLVYDNLTNNLRQRLDPGGTEVGDQITLSGTQRYPSRLTFEYWGTNAIQDSFAGEVTARVRFYRNDGPTVSVGGPSPGTVFYDSGPMPISATQRGTLVLQDFQLSAAMPLQGALPETFTWTILFSGLGSQDAAGLSLYGPPVTGQAASGYWAFESTGWAVEGQAGTNFGAQLAALSSGVNLSVSSTVTNSLCGRGFAVTRSWQALDTCNKSASCSQTVNVVDQSAPLILVQPQGQAALLGQDVSFTVDVSSCPPTTYQWYFNQTNVLNLATSSNLLLTNVTLAQAGFYHVVIVNPYGTTTSTPAPLVLSGTPTIITQPLDEVAALGGSATFTVSAIGLPAPTYQWMFNDTNVLVGETAPSLTLTKLQTNQVGFYSVIVSNSVGVTTSSRAQLSLAQLPVITLQPQSLIVQQGQAVTLTVTAVGTAPLAYQWMANCTRPISGATTNSLRLKSAAPTDSGSYCVTVSNAFGSVLSQPAVLRVLAQAKLTSLSQDQSGVSLSFSTVTNLIYSVYSSQVLPTTNWTILPGAFQQPGTGAPMTVHDPTATGPRTFYRIVVE